MHSLDVNPGGRLVAQLPFLLVRYGRGRSRCNSKWIVADSALSALVDDLAVEQLTISWRTKRAIAAWVVRIFDTLNAKARLSLLGLLTTTAQQ